MLNWRSGLRFLWQAPCPLCHRLTAEIFCLDCTRQLRGCQMENPIQDWQGDFPRFIWGHYQDALKRAIATLKYQHQPQVAEALGEWLGQTWQATIQNRHPRAYSALTVVPIPLHWERQAQRGYNQSTLLARPFCRITGLSLQDNVLVRHRATAPQYSLSVQKRVQNLDQAFSVQPKFVPHLKTHPILLLDDIYTTGATARAAMQALQASHLKVVGIVAVAQS